MKKYYLAYGSNLNINEMAFRCPLAKKVGTVNIKDYRLVYKGSSDLYSYLTIEECQGYNVPLGLYEVSFFDVFLLDKYEGYPELYSKFYIPIKIDNKDIEALIYIMNEKFDYYLPSLDYVRRCIKGYEDFGFDKTILDTALLDTIENMKKKIR